MKKIDMENWNRKSHYEYYHSLPDPRYAVTFEADVTDIHHFAKKNGLSFYYCMVYAVTKAMNSIENFRYFTMDEEVYASDFLWASFTDLKEGSDVFHISSLPVDMDIFEFNDRAKELRNNPKGFYDFGVSPKQMVHISSTPWIYLTGLVREINSTDRANDTAPHVVWGKYKEDNGKKILNMNVEVNHQFVDGIHIGKFYEIFKGEYSKNENQYCNDNI